MAAMARTETFIYKRIVGSPVQPGDDDGLAITVPVLLQRIPLGTVPSHLGSVSFGRQIVEISSAFIFILQNWKTWPASARNSNTWKHTVNTVEGSGRISLHRFSLSHLKRLWVPRLHKNCNSRNRRLPRRGPDIKLLNGGYLARRDGTVSFHGTYSRFSLHSRRRMEL